MGDMSSVHQDLGVECGAEATMMSLSAFKVLIMCGKRQVMFGGLSLCRRIFFTDRFRTVAQPCLNQEDGKRPYPQSFKHVTPSGKCFSVLVVLPIPTEGALDG